MSEPNSPDSQVITAKWKTEFDALEEFYGTVTLDDKLILNFPFLRSHNEVPPGTTLLWGLTSKLEKCTAITLPFPPHGHSFSNDHPERSFNTQAPINRLLIGRDYIANPKDNFVTEISFTPEPNDELHIGRLYQIIQPKKDIESIEFSPSCTEDSKEFAEASFVYFRRQDRAISETSLPDLGLIISAWMGGTSSNLPDPRWQSRINFTIHFDTPHSLEAAMNEALKFCVFLSFLTHQYVNPSEFRLKGIGEREFYQLHAYGIRSAHPSRNRWVKHTLVIPDEDPDQFSFIMQKWYSSAEDYLRCRYLYRYSLEEPDNFSTERFLVTFQALEGIVKTSKSQFLTNEEFEAAEKALKAALPHSEKVDALIGKLRSSNTESPKSVLKRELPKILTAANIKTDFDIGKFIDRVYLRRNKASHGGAPQLEDETIEHFMDDTALLTAIYLIIECHQLGMNAREAYKKFSAAFLWMNLPLSVVD